MLLVEVDVLKVSADALNIPENLTISVEGLQAGDSIIAADGKTR